MKRINLWSAEIVVGYDSITRNPIHTGVVIASNDYPSFEAIRAEFDRYGLHAPLLSGCKLYNLPPFVSCVKIINNVVLL